MAIRPLTLQLQKNEAYNSSDPSKISALACKTLQELALSLALTAVCAPFASSALTLQLGVISLLGVGGNLFMRLTLPSSELPCSLSFATFSAINPTTLIHEAGHALAASKLFVCTPTVRLLSFARAATTYSPTGGLTALGQSLGYRRCIGLIAVAGPIATLISATVALVAGLVFQSPYLLAVGMVQCVAHAGYAASALFLSPGHAAHDFVRLRAFGLHPLIASLFFTAILLGTCSILKDCTSEKSFS